MTRIVQMPGGSSASEDTIVGSSRQIRVDTERDELRLHDGVTPGGVRIPNLEALLGLFISKSEGLTGDVGFPETGAGILVRLAEGTYEVRSLGAGDGVTVENPLGSAGNPSYAVDVTWLNEFIDALRALTADVRAGTGGKLLTVAETHAAAAYVTVPYAAQIALDFATGYNFILPMNGNLHLIAPTNVKMQAGLLEINVTGTDRVLSIGGVWIDPAGHFPVTLQDGDVAYLSYAISATNRPVVHGFMLVPAV